MVYIHLADGFEEIEAVTIMDVLRRGEVQAKFVSVTGELEITGAHGIRVKADLPFEEADYDTCEMIVLPGGMPGTQNLKEHPGLTEKIKAFALRRKKMAAICAAPMIFGSMGIIKGKKATIYPGMETHLKDGIPVKEKVQVSENIITGQSPGTALEFSVELVKILKGEKVAKEVKEYLCMK
mgnify:FL=1